MRTSRRPRAPPQRLAAPATSHDFGGGSCDGATDSGCLQQHGHICLVQLLCTEAETDYCSKPSVKPSGGVIVKDDYDRQHLWRRQQYPPVLDDGDQLLLVVQLLLLAAHLQRQHVQRRHPPPTPQRDVPAHLRVITRLCLDAVWAWSLQGNNTARKLERCMSPGRQSSPSPWCCAGPACTASPQNAWFQSWPPPAGV